jgi:hypothetical protein
MTMVEYWYEKGLEITVEGPEGRFSVKVEKPFARVGRHEASEVVLPDKGTPYRSLYLHATKAGIFYVRLRSSPSENGQGDQGWLAPGQLLNVGPCQIAVQLAGGQVEPDVPPPDFEGRETVPPYPVLTLVDHGKTIARCLLLRRFTVVGRDQHCTLRLADSQISTSHCVLYHEAGKLWAIDLLSTNGTFTVGERLTTALVAPGQTLTLGDHVELVYSSTSQTDGKLDELTRHVTSRMIQFNRQARRRRLLLTAAVGLLVLLAVTAAVAAAIFFLPESYLADLRKCIPFLGNRSR